MMNRVDVDDAYRRYSHSVRRRAFRLLGSASDAEDVVQDVFMKIIDEPDAFEGRSALLTFLYRMTTTRCLDRIRTRGARARLHAANPPEETSQAPGDAGVWARRVLATVPEDEATAAVYHYADGMTHDEIATIMGCSRRHVGNLLERLAERLAARERTDERAAGI